MKSSHERTRFISGWPNLAVTAKGQVAIPMPMPGRWRPGSRPSSAASASVISEISSFVVASLLKVSRQGEINNYSAEVRLQHHS